MPGRVIIAALLSAALTAGCSLNWDAPRPVAPADARTDGPAADAGPAADQAIPDAETDMYWQDLSWSDAQKDAAPQEAGPADMSPDFMQTDAPPCGFRFSGEAAADASAGRVNALVTKGWTPTHFVHATDDHAAWLVDKNKYEVARATTGKGLETLVKARLSAGKTVVELLANKEYAVWMESTGSTTAYNYVGGAKASTVATDIEQWVKKGWKVSTFANQPPPEDYAVWLRKGDAFKLLESKWSTTLEKDLTKEHAAGWIPQRFLARINYIGWGYNQIEDKYKYALYTGSSGLTGWLQANVFYGYDSKVVQSSHLHAVWLTNGHIIYHANDGWDLAGQLYKHQQKIKGAKVERFFAKKGYVVWLYKACP